MASNNYGIFPMVLLGSIFSVIFIAIEVGLIFGILYPDVKEQREYTKTECTIINNTDIISENCCQIVDCQCEECLGTRSCSDMVNNFTSGACCDRKPEEK